MTRTLASKSFRIRDTVVTFYLNSDYVITYLIDSPYSDEVYNVESDATTIEEAKHHYAKYCNEYKAEMLIISNLDTDRRDKRLNARFDELNNLCHGLIKKPPTP